jgi:Tfp pilus assembly protein PilO
MNKMFVRNKPLFIHLLSAASLFAIFLFITSFFLGKIGKIRTEITTLQAESKTLEQRVMALNDAQQSSISSVASEVLIALPSSNPSLLVVSQLRKIAAEKELVLDNLSVDPITAEGQEFPSISIEFRVKGDSTKIMQMLTELSRISPITNVDNLRINTERNSSEALANVALKSFWSSLPTELPPLSQPILSLSAAEISVIEKINSFTKPVINEVQPTGRKDFRPNPFQLEL